MIYAPGVTSQSIDVGVYDDSGLPVTGLVAATFPPVTYSRAGANADASVSLSDLAALTTAWSSGGLKERGGGVYRLDLPDAAFASAGLVTVRGDATGKHLVAPRLEVGKVAASVNSADTTGLPLAADYTSARAAKLDNLDAAVSSRSTYAGGAVASVTGSVGSIAGVTFPANFGALGVTAAGVVRAFNDAGAALASHADVLAINTSSSKHLILATVGQYERPESGTVSYTVEARTYAADGTAADADSTPTLTATGSLSGDVSVNVAAPTHPATGVYRWQYTVASTATVEQIRFDVSATISSATFTLSAYTQVADFVATTFTTADRTLLTNTNTRVLLALPAVAAGGLGGLPTGLGDGSVNVNSGQLFTGVYTTHSLGQILKNLDAGTTANGVVLASNQSQYAPQKAGAAVTLPANPPAGFLNAGSVAAGALNGAGDWNTTAPDNAGIAAIKAKTDNLPTSPAAVGDAMTLTDAERDAVADAHINRNIKGGSSTGRTVGQVYAAQRNKVAFDVPAVGQFTVFDVDDTSVLWTGAYTASAGANPVTSLDPA